MSVPLHNYDITKMAKEAVKLVLGKENEYVERLLVDKLFGVSKEYSFTPLSELVPPQHRDELKKELVEDTKNTQNKAVKVLTKVTQPESDNTLSTTQHVIVDVGSMITNLPDNVESVNGIVDVSDNQAISSWIVNIILQEKLNYREVQEKAERRKTLYGVIASVLPFITPFITGVIQYYLTKYIYSSE
jgi:hypothetical protein